MTPSIGGRRPRRPTRDDGSHKEERVPVRVRIYVPTYVLITVRAGPQTISSSLLSCEQHSFMVVHSHPL